jgi:putative SOS response-associated peptidase YedK
MCYSSMVRSDLQKITRAFGADVDVEAFIQLYLMREKNLDLKIPAGMDNSLVIMSPKIRGSIRNYQKLYKDRCEQEIEDLDAELKEIEARLKVKPTKTWTAKLATRQRQRERIQKKMQEASAPYESERYRIYPFYFAPVVVMEKGKRMIRPMRYRVLPKNGIELPSKYNLFNARRDSLLSARTWKESFGRTHAVFPFMTFYEWVQGKGGRPREIVFNPDGFEDMWAASLYSQTKTKEGLLESFAMVTDDPPPEVRAAGHDRCPVFMDHTLLDEWLAPKGKTLDELDGLLSHKEKTHFSHAQVA